MRQSLRSAAPVIVVQAGTSTGTSTGRTVIGLLVMGLVALSQWGCSGVGPPRVARDAGWVPAARGALDGLLAQRVAAGPGGLAVFDWDNTVIKGDIGATTVWWMLRNDKVLQPPGRDWAAASRWLTARAVAELSAACGDLAEPGSPLPTSTDPACAEAIGALYVRGTVRTGEPAFEGWDRWRFRPTTGWQSVLLSGYTPAEARALARAAFEEAAANPVGTTWRVGSLEVEGWLRVRPAIRDLMAKLREVGVEVWVVSASPQAVVEAVAGEAGVPSGRVVGIRTELDAAGRLTPRFTPCGGPEGADDRLITYVEGKRCWINQAILGISGPAALERQPASRRPLLVAGDATTDLTMLGDATALALVIDRGSAPLRCRALNDTTGRWVVQPPLEGEAPPRVALACATTACEARDGSPAPCLSDEGRVLPDVAPQP